MNTAKSIWAFIGTVLSLEFIFSLVLSGCSVLMVPRWDATEYNDLVTIASVSSKGACQPEQVQTLSDLSSHLKYYSEFLPNNELMASGAAQMDITIQELNVDGHIGASFCLLKLRTIHTMAKALAEASGRKSP